jgi:hypothetical protein
MTMTEQQPPKYLEVINLHLCGVAFHVSLVLYCLPRNCPAAIEKRGVKTSRAIAPLRKHNRRERLDDETRQDHVAYNADSNKQQRQRRIQ